MGEFFDGGNIIISMLPISYKQRRWLRTSCSTPCCSTGHEEVSKKVILEIDASMSGRMLESTKLDRSLHAIDF